jgi:hypothetical protein
VLESVPYGAMPQIGADFAAEHGRRGACRRVTAASFTHQGVEGRQRSAVTPCRAGWQGRAGATEAPSCLVSRIRSHVNAHGAGPCG